MQYRGETVVACNEIEVHSSISGRVEDIAGSVRGDTVIQCGGNDVIPGFTCTLTPLVHECYYGWGFGYQRLKRDAAKRAGHVGGHLREFKTECVFATAGTPTMLYLVRMATDERTVVSKVLL